jgi:glutathione S-transferase
MISLHHLDHSRSQRIHWLLEELDLGYELVFHHRDRRTLLAPLSLRAVHPLGKAPILTDDGVVVAESGAIVEYLVSRYGRGEFQPEAGSAEHRQYLYWLHYAEGSLMPLLVMRLVFARMVANTPALLRPLTRGIVRRVHAHYLGPQLKLHQDVIETHLRDHLWFAGESLSGADILMSYPLQLLREHAAGGGDDADTTPYPQIDQYLARLQSRPAWQRAATRGGSSAPLF